MKSALCSLLFSSCWIFSFAQTSTLNRTNDPVIISGANLTTFAAVNPSEIVGFNYINATWTQIPIQIDERALLDIVTPYGTFAGAGGGSGYLPPAPSASNPKIYFYCDVNTFVGADPDLTFDSDDELVFMSKDAGGIFNGADYPAGIVSGICQQITVTDPLNNTKGYVYLFKNAGNLQQGAGSNSITYSSNLASTTGFPANNNGTNSENTLISTAKYSWHFSSEWVSDELKINLGTNVDILDRHKAFFANGSQGCARHEGLFSSGENAFVVCKTGPVRVIRSYMGAQSGPLTQRTHLFYEGRHDIITNLRVHAIPSIYDAFDYTPAASGMIYRNSLNTTGVTIDGLPDTPASGLPVWEQVAGAQGSLSIVNQLVTNFGASDGTPLSYYNDNSANPASNCTGTDGAWGTSGLGYLFASGICTDCYNTPSNFRSFEIRKTLYFDAPNASAALAADYSNQSANPFQLAFSSCETTADANDLNSNPTDKIVFYPNPVKESLTVQLPGQWFDLTIYDRSGREIGTQHQSFDQINLDCSQFPAGIYFLKVTGSQKTFTGKFVKD